MSKFESGVLRDLANKGSQHEVKQPWNAPNTEAWLALSIRGHAVVASHLVDHSMSETVKEIGQNHSYSSYG